MTDFPAILEAILSGYALSPTDDHGVVHWARVWENGERIAAGTPGVDVEVVRLFALFHDARRVNQYRDPGHGMRGGDFARALRASLIDLDDERFALLHEACRLHTDGLTEADPTLQACWDADRLDLGRVGITPRPHLLCTDAARGLLAWADARAVSGHEPASVLAAWGWQTAG